MGVVAFLLSNWRTVGIALLVTAAGGYIAALRIERDMARSEFKKEHEAFAWFKAKVAAEGEIAKQRAQAIAAHDELLKEEADSGHQIALDKLHADLERVRHERDAARSSFLSAAPAGSKCPDGQTCFDIAELERAYGSLVVDLRAIADEGSEIAVDLQTAQRWAHGRERSP